MKINATNLIYEYRKHSSKFIRMIYVKITKRNQYFCTLDGLYFHLYISVFFCYLISKNRSKNHKCYREEFLTFLRAVYLFNHDITVMVITESREIDQAYVPSVLKGEINIRAIFNKFIVDLNIISIDCTIKYLFKKYFNKFEKFDKSNP